MLTVNYEENAVNSNQILETVLSMWYGYVKECHVTVSNLQDKTTCPITSCQSQYINIRLCIFGSNFVFHKEWLV